MGVSHEQRDAYKTIGPTLISLMHSLTYDPINSYLCIKTRLTLQNIVIHLPKRVSALDHSISEGSRILFLWLQPNSWRKSEV